jgi:hypothetical protein
MTDLDGTSHDLLAKWMDYRMGGGGELCILLLYDVPTLNPEKIM